MANTYYHPGEERAARVDALFGRIAPRYDLVNDLQSFGLHRIWKRRLVSLTHPISGDRALDVCCGTGDIAFALARRGVRVAAIDGSEPMLAIARKRAAKFATVPSVNLPEFIRADAVHLPFPDNSFDIVTIGYGLRNLADWTAGLREMFRVARPGARLAVLDFGKPSNTAWRAAYFCYLRICVPLFGRVFCKDGAAYSYILESLRHFPAQGGVDDQLRALGCRSTSLIEPLGGIMGLNLGVKS